MTPLPTNSSVWTERLFSFEQYNGHLGRGLSW